MFLQVQTESSEVARRVLAIHHCGRRDGHEDPRRLLAAQTVRPGTPSEGRILRLEPNIWSPLPSAAESASGRRFSYRCTEPAGGLRCSDRPRWERGSGSTPGSTGSSGRLGVREGVRWSASCCADGRRSSGWPRNVQGGGRTGAGLVEGWSIECHLRKREKMDFRLAWNVICNPFYFCKVCIFEWNILTFTQPVLLLLPKTNPNNWNKIRLSWSTKIIKTEIK